MILIDSSIWIDHFRHPIAEVHALAAHGAILGHPFVTGELATGSLHVKHALIVMLRSLPQLQVLSEDDFMGFLDRRQLNGLGLGFVDVHLLGAVSHASECQLWTRDKRLAEQAERLGLLHTPR